MANVATRPRGTASFAAGELAFVASKGTEDVFDSNVDSRTDRLIYKPKRRSLSGRLLVDVSVRRIAAGISLMIVVIGLSSVGYAQVLLTLLGHTDDVTSIAFSPNGGTIASGSRDKTIKLWEASSGRLLRTLQAHDIAVTSVAFSPDGRMIASGGADDTIKLWDVVNGFLLQTLRGHTSSVNSVAFSPDGRLIASVSSDTTLKLWGVANGRLLRTLHLDNEFGFTAVFSPDGRTIASGGEGDPIKLWDVASGRLVRKLDDDAYSIAFSPNGRTIASVGFGYTLDLFDASSGRRLRTLHRGGKSVAFSPDGRTIISGGDDPDNGISDLMFWDVASGGLLRTLHVKGSVSSVTFSPDGRTIATGGWTSATAAITMNGVIYIWDATPPVAAPALPIATEALPTKPSGPAAAVGRRVALIIANAAYREAPLSNPIVDAAMVEDSLQKIGFAVTVKTNLDLDAFDLAISEFADAAKGADLALFYFAGHGFSVTLDGHQQNMLMATSANFQAKTALALQQGGEPIEHLEETIIGRAKATLIFVDACRNIPVLANRGVGSRGFEPFVAGSFEGAYVVLSTRQGRTAMDGDNGKGSPFARAFAAVIPIPGLRIEDAYARIREKVRLETSGEQVPDVIRSDLPEGGVTLKSAVNP